MKLAAKSDRWRDACSASRIRRISAESKSLVLQLLRDVQVEIGGIRAEMATKSNIAELRSEMTSLCTDVAANFIKVHKQ